MVLAVQDSEPLGAVTATEAADTIVNTALLMSVMLPFEASVILILPFVEGTFGTVHAYVPADAAVLAIICVELVPPSVEYSSLTLVTLELVQVMF